MLAGFRSMRITDTPVLVTTKDGQVQFECAGTTALLDPSLARLVGQRLVARVRAAQHGKLAEMPERGLDAGQQLIASATEAARRSVTAPLPVAA